MWFERDLRGYLISELCDSICLVFVCLCTFPEFLEQDIFYFLCHRFNNGCWENSSPRYSKLGRSLLDSKVKFHQKNGILFRSIPV